MRRTKLLAGVATLLVAAPVSAETLREALVKAYNTNPTLAGQRANVRAIDENVPIARSFGLPSVNVNANFAENVIDGAVDPLTALSTPKRQITGQANLSVPLYSGGSVRNSVRAADTRVDAGRLNLRGTESSLFTAVVGAYMDVIRDEAIVGLNQQNVHVLDVNLQASKDRFQVGDLTRTDVAQSEARLAVSRSQLQSAQAQLISSRENYIRVVGTVPGTLEVPPPLPNLPPDPDRAVEVALTDNPTLLAAQKSSDAAGYDIRVARAGRLPQVSGIVDGNYYNYLNSIGAGPIQGFPNASTTASIGLGVSIPLYQGGRPAAQVRQAQERRTQAIELVTETERGVIAQARSAYAVWKSSLEVIASSETAVDANKLSLEGVRAENSVGNRTILDILNAEQELLNSQVTLVTARRDAYVAGFALLAVMGRAEARDLGLDGGALYDPLVNYRRVRGNIWDYGSQPDPKATGTSTSGTPAQGSEVAPSLDPILEPAVDTGGPNPPVDVPKNR